MKRLLFVLLLAMLVTDCSPTVAPTRTTPDGKPAETGPVFIDATDLLVMESYPVQINLHINGSLPTPCHTFHYAYVIGITSDPTKVEVTVWSESDTSRMCTQVLEPFDESIPIDMAGAADGAYSVYVNGAFVGEFNYPA